MVLMRMLIINLAYMHEFFFKVLKKKSALKSVLVLWVGEGTGNTGGKIFLPRFGKIKTKNINKIYF